MTSSPDHSILATACKATTVEHAAVQLVDTSTWDHIGSPLSGHSLTVTRIVFHPDPADGRILTVSRDRSWRLWDRDKAEGQKGHSSVGVQGKAHARMILDACWTRNGFATAGRDKSVSYPSLKLDIRYSILDPRSSQLSDHGQQWYGS